MQNSLKWCFGLKDGLKFREPNENKDRGIDAQYYIKIGKEEDIKQMLKESKIFISMFDELVSNISKKEIESYRIKLKRAI